jgi:non-ribosomal peptide synthetase component F
MPVMDLGLAKSDLSINVVRAGDRLDATARYNTDLYHPETIDALLRRWLTILRNMIEADDKPVSQFSMTDPAEHQMLLTAALAEPVRAPSGGSILDLFEGYAATQPAAPAVISDAGRRTYEELDRYANFLVRRLIGNGVRPGDRAFFIASTVADLAREVDKLSSGREQAVADQITAVRREYFDQGTVHG